MPDGNPASEYSTALLEGMVRAGVRHLVVSPGSRSQALALAAAELEASGQVTLHVRIDERSAGFFALGVGIDTGMPAVLITTSGTAVANLHPAVLESHHAGVPLIVVSADRPQEMRGVGANQATVQPGIFAGAVRWLADVEAPAGEAGEVIAAAELAGRAVRVAAGTDGDPAGPVHLNVAFRDPLAGPVVRRLPDADAEPERGSVGVEPDLAAGGTPEVLVKGPLTVVIAGDKAGLAAELLARSAGWPLIAEVTSGARFGPNLVPAYRRLLAAPELGGRVQRVVVFGHPTLSREIPALILRADVETIVVGSTGGEAYNPGRRVSRFVPSVITTDGESEPEPGWLRSWVVAGRAAAAERSDDIPFDPEPEVASGRSASARQSAIARAELSAVRAEVTRRSLVEAVWRVTWPHDRLIFAASRLIREADDAVPSKKIPVAANRGLAGIDGTISTALGIAAGASRAPTAGAGTTRVVVGDLALLHDVGALLWAEGEARPRLQIIVGNDRGGTIFDGLEVAGVATAAAFDRVLLTPRAVDLASLARAYGWSYSLVQSRGELDGALTAPFDGPSILEVPLPR